MRDARARLPTFSWLSPLEYAETAKCRTYQSVSGEYYFCCSFPRIMSNEHYSVMRKEARRCPGILISIFEYIVATLPEHTF